MRFGSYGTKGKFLVTIEDIIDKIKLHIDKNFLGLDKVDNTSDRTIPTLKQGQPTLTSCSGYLMSATSAGLLAAMTLVDGAGKVIITVEGA